MSVLIVAEHLRGELRPITLELISAAKELQGPVAVAVIAKDPPMLTPPHAVVPHAGLYIRAHQVIRCRTSVVARLLIPWRTLAIFPSDYHLGAAS